MNKNLNKRIALYIFLYMTMVLFPVSAIGSLEINDSIVKGIEWILDQQNVGTDSWGEGYPVAITGLAVLAMEEKAVKLDDRSPFESIYKIPIKNGLNYIFTNFHDFDENGDGVVDSIYFCSPGSEYFVYETGIAMMAIAASLQPDAKVIAPSSSLNGKSYLEVEQMASNYIKFAQKENGGWTYSATRTSNSDNSNTGYAILGIDYSRDKFKIPIPDEVKSRLNSWIDYLQCPESGGAGYNAPCNDYMSILETGNLVYEMAVCGDNHKSSRARNAIDYIGANWNVPNWMPGWKGPGGSGQNWSNYQATFIAMKGFERIKAPRISVSGNETDWFNEMASAIVAEQNPDGSWNETWESEAQKILATEWALLTLEKAVPIDDSNVSSSCCPSIINISNSNVVFNINYMNGASNNLIKFGSIYTNSNDFSSDEISSHTSSPENKSASSGGYVPPPTVTLSDNDTITAIQKVPAFKKNATDVWISGSTSALPIVDGLANEFNKDNTKYNVIVMGAGSVDSIDMLVEGKIDIAMLSEPFEDVSCETGKRVINKYHNNPAVLRDIEQNIFAKDCLCIIVSKPVYESGIKNINRKQIKDIYNKDSVSWSYLGGSQKNIFVTTRNIESDTRTLFNKAIFNDTLATNPGAGIQLDTNEKVVMTVGHSDKAIGYVSFSYRNETGVQVIALDGVVPSVDAVLNGSYPLIRDLYLYNFGNCSPGAREFINYCLSIEGQKKIEELGYIKGIATRR